MKTFADFINTLDWKYDPEWLRSRQKGVEVKHTDRYVIVRDKDKGITRVTRKYNPETGLSDDPNDEIKVQNQDSEGQTQTQPVKRGRGRPPGKYGTYKGYNKTGKYAGVHAARKQKAQEAYEYIMNLDSEEEIENFITNLDEDTFDELYYYLIELEESEIFEENMKKMSKAQQERIQRKLNNIWTGHSVNAAEFGSSLTTPRTIVIRGRTAHRRHADRKQKAQEAFEYIMSLESEEEVQKFMNTLEDDVFVGLSEYLSELAESEKSEENGEFSKDAFESDKKFASTIAEMQINPISVYTHPASPLNPSSPLWIGHAANAAGASGGTVSPETIKVLFNILTAMFSGAVAVGAKLIADKILRKTFSLAKGKLEVDTKELKEIQSQIKTIYGMLNRTKNPETRAKYEAMLKDAYEALEEIKHRVDMKVKGKIT